MDELKELEYFDYVGNRSDYHFRKNDEEFIVYLYDTESAEMGFDFRKNDDRGIWTTPIWCKETYYAIFKMMEQKSRIRRIFEGTRITSHLIVFYECLFHEEGEHVYHSFYYRENCIIKDSELMERIVERLSQERYSVKIEKNGEGYSLKVEGEIYG